MDQQIKIKFTPKKITITFYVFIAIITLIALVCVSSFLYKNFYLGITQSKKIIFLKEKVIVETVDIDKFNQIFEKIKKKTVLRRLNNISDPF